MYLQYIFFFLVAKAYDEVFPHEVNLQRERSLRLEIAGRGVLVKVVQIHQRAHAEAIEWKSLKTIAAGPERKAGGREVAQQIERKLKTQIRLFRCRLE